MSKYKHECPAWDYAEIDEDMTEFAFCECYPNDFTAWDHKSDRWTDIDEVHIEASRDFCCPFDAVTKVRYEQPTPEQMELDFNS